MNDVPETSGSGDGEDEETRNGGHLLNESMLVESTLQAIMKGIVLNGAESEIE